MYVLRHPVPIRDFAFQAYAELSFERGKAGMIYGNGLKPLSTNERNGFNIDNGNVVTVYLSRICCR